MSVERSSWEPVLRRLAENRHEGVEGCFEIAGLGPGPTLGITVLTHGNEPSGLAAAGAVLDLADAGWRPASGRIILVVNNLSAADLYTRAETDDERLKARFIDLDMNRLPKDLSGSAYEVERARQLLPVWSQFDVGFDIHSVGQESAPMIVEGYGDSTDLTRSFPVEVVLRGIAEVQIGAPAFAFYGARSSGAETEPSPSCVTFEIETGWHESPAAFDLAVDCTLNLLRALDMLEGRAGIGASPKVVYEVCGSLLVPNEHYRLTQMFPTFHPCRRGEILAVGPGPGRRGHGAALAAPMDGHIIFAPKSTIPPNPKGEVLFFTLPARAEL